MSTEIVMHWICRSVFQQRRWSLFP